MKIVGRILKFVFILIILIIVFNRIAPYLLGKSEIKNEEMAKKEVVTEPMEILLPNESGVITARPIEYGNWLINLSDSDAILEESFNELGMLSCDPEFELFVKFKINEVLPESRLAEAIIDFSLDCAGNYEIHLKDQELVKTILEIAQRIYQSKETLNQESKIFKNKVKACLSNTGEMESYICQELKVRPLPKPVARLLQQEDGTTIPMKGFSECYYKITDAYQGEVTEKLAQEAQEACYSSW